MSRSRQIRRNVERLKAKEEHRAATGRYGRVQRAISPAEIIFYKSPEELVEQITDYVSTLDRPNPGRMIQSHMISEEGYILGPFIHPTVDIALGIHEDYGGCMVTIVPDRTRNQMYLLGRSGTSYYLANRWGRRTIELGDFDSMPAALVEAADRLAE